MKLFKAIVLFSFLLLSACAGPNPNPGERTADVLWAKYNHQEALDIITPKAEEGLPWAQLRLGVAYELGNGVEQNYAKALKWYKKAAAQQTEGDWADGQIAGATGEPGYFNQNSDAMVAQYQIANIYLHGKGVEKNLVSAYLWAKHVLISSAGEDVFFCCEFEGGRYITQSAIKTTFDRIKNNMTAEQIANTESMYKSWKLSAE